MGIVNSKPTDPEVIIAREHRSEHLQEQRSRRHKLFSSMVKRVISTSNKTSIIDQIPGDIFFLILEFLTPDLPTLLSVSAKWHVKIYELIDSAFNSIETQFAIVHSNLLCFKKSYTDFTQMTVSNIKGIRIDRVIVAEVLPYLNGKTLKIRYNYRHSHYTYYQKAEYKLDCQGNNKRIIWAHRDECKFHGEDGKKAFTQQIPLVNTKTNIELAINWYNLSGNINLDSIQWQTPIIQDTKEIINNLQLSPKFPRGPQDDSDGITKKLYLYNVSRHCELELSQTEWYDAKYYLKPSQVYDYDFFYPFLKLVSSEFAGVDVTVSRNTYKAERVGIVPDSVNRIGIMIEVLEKDMEITQEVKRMGLVYDRHKPVELFVGDTFVLYISRGG
ncbi:hypothetical protein SteCoe_11826 [Stentor coeruleus]|uniref:F-box domain-containing protein n=1 Tax=Stentor coeruleus TaxID=5963 RepID=A0A1R2CCA5_9CILI|nr:hypothetical protein SteCoe_11826 [Stentor coeruleus]